MGKSVSGSAFDTLNDILPKLCVGRNTNTYALDYGNGKTRIFHFEEDNEAEQIAKGHDKDGSIAGSIYEHTPNGCTRFSDVVIDGDGNLLTAPISWFLAQRGNLSNLVDPEGLPNSTG